MQDIIVILIVGLIVALAAIYIYRAKKSGKKCIGCPDADNCGKNENSACNGCNSDCCGCK